MNDEDDSIWCPFCGDYVYLEDYCHEEPMYCPYYEHDEEDDG